MYLQQQYRDTTSTTHVLMCWSISSEFGNMEKLSHPLSHPRWSGKKKNDGGTVFLSFSSLLNSFFHHDPIPSNSSVSVSLSRSLRSLSFQSPHSFLVMS